jgi:hypothetical protein
MQRTIELYYNFDTMKIIDEDGVNLSETPMMFLRGDNRICYNIKTGAPHGTSISNKNLSTFTEWRMDIGLLGTTKKFATSSNFTLAGTTAEAPYIDFSNSLAAGRFTVSFSCDTAKIEEWLKISYAKSLYAQIYVRKNTGEDAVLVRHFLSVRNNIKD